MEQFPSLRDLRVIFLWGLAAFLAGNVIGLLFLFFFNALNIHSFIMFLPVVIFYAFAYGYCASEAVKKLKRKTSLAWWNIAIYMAGIVIVLSLVVPAFITVTFGIELRSSSNVAGIIAIFAGSYLGGKNDKK